MHANSKPFSELCNILDVIEKQKNIQEKEKILHKFITDYKSGAVNAVDKNATFYPILRLMVPSLERERGAYNMKKKKLGALLVKVLCLNKSSADAMKLLKESDADFANTAYFVLKSRLGQKTSNMTIEEINNVLDKIASAEAGSTTHVVDEIFSCIIKNLAAEHIKWFLRIILKDLKIGLSAKKILSCYHPDAPEYYDTFSNVAKVCEELDDAGNVRPLDMGIQLFYAVSPMLSERLDITDVADLSLATSYQVEEKFDGERFQIHMENHKFEYFSRRGFSYSSVYGKTYESGLLTPHIQHKISGHIYSFILDGEMMGWDKQLKCFGSKGMAFDVKKLTEKSRFRPCFVAFDVLYYNGNSLVGSQTEGGMSLLYRLKLLDKMFIDVEGVIMHSKREAISVSFDILTALNYAIENQQEGIVVKDCESMYISNKRNAGWYKIKPEYTDGVMDDLDLVVIGVDAPNPTMAKSFFVALADSVQGSGEAHRWVCSGRVSTGLSLEERAKVTAALASHWQSADLALPPQHLVFNKAKPDFWIEPHHSIVFQVRATELIRSSEYGTPYTLRFPRIKRVREDKPVKDTMTLDEFNKLITNHSSVVKLGTKRVSEAQIGNFEVKTRKKRPINYPQVPDEFKVSFGDVCVLSCALQGRKICILSDDDDCKRDQLGRIVESHGGKVVANAGPEVWCYIVGKSTIRTQAFLESTEADVTTTAWLRALEPSQVSCFLSPLDMIAMKQETRFTFAREYDPFGDHYTEPADAVSLNKCFQKMEINEIPLYLTKQEMLDLDNMLFQDNNSFSFLRPCCIHNATNSSLLALRCKMYGATLCDIQDEYVTHIIVPKTMRSADVDNIKAKSKGLVVSEEWLEGCFLADKLINETSYLK